MDEIDSSLIIKDAILRGLWMMFPTRCARAIQSEIRFQSQLYSLVQRFLTHLLVPSTKHPHTASSSGSPEPSPVHQYTASTHPRHTASSLPDQSHRQSQGIRRRGSLFRFRRAGRSFCFLARGVLWGRGWRRVRCWKGKSRQLGFLVNLETPSFVNPPVSKPYGSF
jgi:hypothetical protein